MLNNLPVRLQFELLQERIISDRLGTPIDYTLFAHSMTPDQIEAHKRVHWEDNRIRPYDIARRAEKRRQAKNIGLAARAPSPPAKKRGMGNNWPPTPPPAGGCAPMQHYPQPIGRKKRAIGAKAGQFGCNLQVKDLVGLPADRKLRGVVVVFGLSGVDRGDEFGRLAVVVVAWDGAEKA
ncbi:unnamed protein product, partial [Mesorhabditis spiculigera]